MRKDIEFLHREAYLNERKKRWDMENKSANTIIETFTAYIVQKLPFLIKENIIFFIQHFPAFLLVPIL